MKIKKEKCLFSKCDKKAKTRGDCANHYTMCYERVNKGWFTWKELEEVGLALPPKRRSTSYPTEFNKELAEKIPKLKEYIYE